MSALPKVRPMDLIQVSTPFDDLEFVYEIKFDGFRALAYVDDGRCKLVSRKGHTYKRFGERSESIAADLKVQNGILDGEIVCLDDQGRSEFYDLMFHRREPYFYAFDLLWLDGVDLRNLTLFERKAKLKKVVPSPPSRLLYLDHDEDQVIELFEMAKKQEQEKKRSEKKIQTLNCPRKRGSSTVESASSVVEVSLFDPTWFIQNPTPPSPGRSDTSRQEWPRTPGLREVRYSPLLPETTKSANLR